LNLLFWGVILYLMKPKFSLKDWQKLLVPEFTILTKY